MHGHNEIGGACTASYGKKGDGLGHSHSHSAVPKHVSPQAQHTAHTPVEKHAGRSDREYAHNVLLLTTTHVLPRMEGGTPVPTNHRHVLGEADSVFLNFFFFQYTFLMTHKFPLRFLPSRTEHK